MRDVPDGGEDGRVPDAIAFEAKRSYAGACLVVHLFLIAFGLAWMLGSRRAFGDDVSLPVALITVVPALVGVAVHATWSASRLLRAEPVLSICADEIRYCTTRTGRGSFCPSELRVVGRRTGAGPWPSYFTFRYAGRRRAVVVDDLDLAAPLLIAQQSLAAVLHRQNRQGSADRKSDSSELSGE